MKTKFKLYFCLALFLCAAPYSNAQTGFGFLLGVDPGTYWEFASDGGNSSKSYMPVGGAHFGASAFGEALPWDGGIGINTIFEFYGISNNYITNDGGGIPLVAGNHSNLFDFKIEIIFAFDIFGKNLQFFAGGGPLFAFGVTDHSQTETQEYKSSIFDETHSYFSFGIDLDTGFRLNVGRRLFMLLGTDLSCYFFNYLEYIDKESGQKERRVNSFNVGYAMLGVSPYISIGFNIYPYER
ncbi:MAG: hypothetical protein LBF60_01360 [Treponema sp.]|jgi:hypothetical protein|nr:hypothetical protein [Treponema sp.]